MLKCYIMWQFWQAVSLIAPAKSVWHGVTKEWKGSTPPLASTFFSFHVVNFCTLSYSIIFWKINRWGTMEKQKIVSKKWKGGSVIVWSDRFEWADILRNLNISTGVIFSVASASSKISLMLSTGGHCCKLLRLQLLWIRLFRRFFVGVDESSC